MMRESPQSRSSFIDCVWMVSLTIMAVFSVTVEGQSLVPTPSNMPIDQFVAQSRQLEQLEYSVMGSFEATEVVIADSKRVKAVAIRVSTKPGHKRIWCQSDAGEEVVYSRSPTYAFAVLKKHPNEAWRLATFTEDIDSVAGEKLEFQALGRNGLCILHPLATILPNTLTSKYCEEKADQIRMMTPRVGARQTLMIERSGKPKTSVEVQWTANGLPVIVSTSIVNVVTSDVQMFTKTFNDNKLWPNSDLPQCKAIRSIVKNERQQKELLDVQVEFTSFTSEPPRDELFALSTYGIPEPSGGGPVRQTKRWLWLIMGAGMCGVALAIIRHARRGTARAIRGTSE